MRRMAAGCPVWTPPGRAVASLKRSLAASFSLLTTTDSPIARVEHLGAPHRFLLARLLLIGNRLRSAHQLLVEIDEILAPRRNWSQPSDTRAFFTEQKPFG